MADSLDIYMPTLAFDPPAARSLKVYAYDPSLGRVFGNCMTIDVRYEKLLPGPVGERFAVIDYDGSTGRYYAPVDLDDPMLLLRGGLDPSESDPRFHQQMVYAVASETLERFEAALGRRVHWRRQQPPADTHMPNRLYLHPHAMVQGNAFYSPDAHGIVFGYFRAGQNVDGDLLPGQTVFTCLSHDIVTHEVTHAIIDGIREHFTEPTNIDVPAFHEAFADLAALFRHFAHCEALVETIQRTGGKLHGATLSAESLSGTDTPTIRAEIASDNPLLELARQFGQTGGSRNGLRNALGKAPDPRDIRTVTEPHARGAILVAAVFDAYFSVYQRRTADLFRIFRAGGGAYDAVELPVPLAELLAERASKIASMFFGVCARALDYCPPVDITFGDFLRALITADMDLYPDDSDGVRTALMQGFRARGIVPADAMFFSEDSLCWPKVAKTGAPETILPTVDGLVFGDPNGLTHEEADANGAVLRAYVTANRTKLGLTADGDIAVPSFHPMFRLAQDGSLKIDMVVEVVQTREVPYSEGSMFTRTVRSGVTLIIEKPVVHAGARDKPRVRYAIAKCSSGANAGKQIDFALLHGG